MKRTLTRASNAILYHVVGGTRVDGPHGQISGNVTGLRGNVTGLCGDVSGLTGNVTGLRGNVTGLTGNVTGLRGNVTGLRGNINDCCLTAEDRERGVNVADLIATDQTAAAE